MSHVVTVKVQDVQTPDMTDDAAHAWLEGVAAIAEAVPGGLRAQAEPGLALLATGAPSRRWTASSTSTPYRVAS